MSWKLKDSKEIYRDEYMVLEVDEIVTPFGDNVIYSIVRKKPCALVIPWDGKKFVIERLYRFATSEFSWEFPCGHFQGGSVEKTAVNELEEEIGIIAGNLRKIGVFHPANGFLDQESHVFLATKLNSGKINREKSEKGMRIKKVSESELEDMVRKGDVRDGLTLSAYALLKFDNNWRG